ncbi:MAG: hypothetical protein H0W89_05215 [Candidatus Levybacteria bacterium]|nr:hypothetical protein [Candidatus Levybacteria bacterium]
MNFTKRFTTAIATGAVLVNALAPVALAQEINVAGNGAFSDSAVNVSNNSNTSVNQSNNANVTNKVSSNASTGGNSSNFNTGGDSGIRTGSATSNTEIKNMLNTNKASLPSCGGCAGGAANVNVEGNGAYADTNVGVDNNKSVTLNQDNNANVKNYVDANAKTGGNDSKFNTGGDSAIFTGDAVTVVDVMTKANANVATIGGGNGAAGNSSVTIDGNGAFSDNDVDLSQNSAVVLNQDNVANIKNAVDANSNTGGNDAEFNTDGDVAIFTGDAATGVTVDNAVNFNMASIDCDCVLGGLGVTIDGNGAKSLNEVNASSDNALFNHQDNLASLWNDVDGNAKSGHNDSGFGTGGDNGTRTGDSLSVTEVSNEGNVNVLHDGGSLHLPGNWEMDFDFDLSGLMLSLNHWMMA